jgi:hypothetical protein
MYTTHGKSFFAIGSGTSLKSANLKALTISIIGAIGLVACGGGGSADNSSTAGGVANQQAVQSPASAASEPDVVGADSSASAVVLSEIVQPNSPIKPKDTSGLIPFRASDSGSYAGTSTVAGDISRDDVIRRAMFWVDQHIDYSQKISVPGPDADGKIYRTDCSGMVAMALHLKYSYTTVDLPEYLTPISWDDLKPGDVTGVLGKDSWGDYGHVVIFNGWLDAEHTQFKTLEEKGGETNRGAISYKRSKFWTTPNGQVSKPYRYKKIIDQPRFVMSPESGKQYVIEADGTKHWLMSVAEVEKRGGLGKVETVSKEYIDSIPPGDAYGTAIPTGDDQRVLFKDKNDPNNTVYVLLGGQKHHLCPLPYIVNSETKYTDKDVEFVAPDAINNVPTGASLCYLDNQPAPAPVPVETGPPLNQPVFLKNSNSFKCLGVNYNNTQNGSGANQSSCVPADSSSPFLSESEKALSNSQRWIIEPVGAARYPDNAARYRIVNYPTANTGDRKCLSVNGDEVGGLPNFIKQGAHFHLWSCLSEANHPAQTFFIENVYEPGRYRIRLQSESGSCLGVDDRNIQNTIGGINQWGCADPAIDNQGANSQAWFIKAY